MISQMFWILRDISQTTSSPGVAEWVQYSGSCPPLFLLKYCNIPSPPRQTSACSGHLQYSTSTPALCIRSRVFAIITNLQTSSMAFNQSFNRCCFSSKTDFQLEVVLSLQLTLEKCISAKFDYLVLPRMPIDTITTTLCCYLFQFSSCWSASWGGFQCSVIIIPQP